MRRLSDIVLNQKSLMLSRAVLVADACQQMSESHMDSVLVVDEQKRLEGIFTAHDALRRVIDSDRESTSTHLADVMTPHPKPSTELFSGDKTEQKSLWIVKKARVHSVDNERASDS